MPLLVEELGMTNEAEKAKKTEVARLKEGHETKFFNGLLMLIRK